MAVREEAWHARGWVLISHCFYRGKSREQMKCYVHGEGRQGDRVKFMDLDLRESIPSVQRHSCSNTRSWSFTYLGSAGEQIAYQYLKWSHLQRLDSL